MTREEAIKVVDKLGLKGQERAKKIEELIGNKASDFKGGTWIDEAMAGRDGEAEKKIEELEEKKRMEKPIDGAEGDIARGNRGDNAIARKKDPSLMTTSEITKRYEEDKDYIQSKENKIAPGVYSVPLYSIHDDWRLGDKAYGKFIGDTSKKYDYNSVQKKDGKSSLGDLKKNTNDTQYVDALNDSEFVSDVADTMKKDESDYDDMSKIVEKFNEKSSNIDDYYKENLPKTLWNMYKDGDLDGTSGDKEKDKKEAKKRLGYFILNGLGTGLVNASLVARGSAPSQESDLQKVRREKLEGALDRYNQKRNETMNTTIKQLGLNSEMLNKFNMDVDTLKNNKIFDEVSKALDRKGMERTIKAYSLAGNYLEGLTEEQKSNVFMAIMALNSNDGKSAGISYLVSTLGKPLADNIVNLFGE